MSGLMSLFVSLLSIIVWLIALFAIIPIVLYFTNKTLLVKLLSTASTFITTKLKEENKKGNKPLSHQKRQKVCTPNEDNKLDEKLWHLQKNNEQLQEKVLLRNKEIKERDETIIRLQNQIINIQKELQTLMDKRVLEGTNKSNPQKELHISPKTGCPLYAYAPTSISPYGFAKGDWQPTENGQTFTMTPITDSKALLSINANCSMNNILSSLAYYNRLIDYDDQTNGNGTSKIEVIKKGALCLTGDVWTVNKKILIKIF